MIRFDPEQLDVCRLGRLVEQGQAARAAGDFSQAREDFARALALWSGDTLAGVSNEPFAAVELARIEELRLTAIESRFAADLDLGRHVEIAADLAAMADRYPYRERLTELVMTALYRSGRQSDALATYESHRRTLLAEMGLEPGRSVRSLQHRILNQHPSLIPLTRTSVPEPHDFHIGPRSRRLRGGVRMLALLAPVVCVAAVLGLNVVQTQTPSQQKTFAIAESRARILRVLRVDRRALTVAETDLGAARDDLTWLTQRYPDQFRLAVHALGWIEQDEASRGDDPTRLLDDSVAIGAIELVGTPYTWGGASPSTGFDASGLVRWLWAQHHVRLPHYAAAQYYAGGPVVDHGPRIHYADLEIGDLMFFDGFSNVAIYIGHGYVIDAPHTGSFVHITHPSASRLLKNYDGAVRVTRAERRDPRRRL